MTANQWMWLLSIVGTIASVAGVVFSWMAWIQAGKAKTAALEAVNKIRLRDAVDELETLTRDAGKLLTSVRSRNVEEIVDSADSLRRHLSIFFSRRSKLIPVNFPVELCKNHLRSICTSLNGGTFPEEQKDAAQLTSKVREIDQQLCELSGKMKGISEEGIR